MLSIPIINSFLIIGVFDVSVSICEIESNVSLECGNGIRTSDEERRALVDVRRGDIENPLPAAGCRSTGLFENHSQRISLVEKTNLAWNNRYDIII